MEEVNIQDKQVTGKEVIEIFERFFGKELVDNNYSEESNAFLITVRFPSVRIVNENNESTLIKELYVRVPVLKDGRYSSECGFTMLRADYPIEHWLSDYAHSHLPGISKRFLEPCLGNGPIIATIQLLRHKNNYLRWELFCDELNTYVGVESLEGIPYRRLSNIGIYNHSNPIGYSFGLNTVKRRTIYSTPLNIMLNEFLSYFVNNYNIKMSYVDGCYKISGDLLELWIKISSSFIQWYNRKKYGYALNTLIGRGILMRVELIGNQVFQINSNYYESRRRTATEDNGTLLFTFKDHPVKLHIRGLDKITQTNNLILLSDSVLSNFIGNVNRIFNTKYEKEESKVGTGKSYYI